MNKYICWLFLFPVLNASVSAVPKASNEFVLNYSCARAITSSIIDLEKKGLQAEYVNNGEVYCRINSDDVEVVFRMVNKKIRGGAIHYYLEMSGQDILKIRIGR